MTKGREPIGSASSLHLSLVCVICGFLLSCAAEGPPRPPRVERPQKVTDLAVAQVGQTIVISFTLPTQATDGERLTKPIEARIFRQIVKPGQIADVGPEKTKPKPWVALLAADVTHYTQGGRLVYHDRLSNQEYTPSQGDKFEFKVQTLTRGFRGRAIESADSNRASLELLDVSGPVQNLSVEATEHSLNPTWSPPSQTLAGHPVSRLTGYRVYRSEGKPDSFQLAGTASAPQYADSNFQFGHIYYYRVQAVFRQGQQTAQSADSATVTIAPQDVFPPHTPQRLTGLYEPGTVELIWDANREPDLAGYNVFRREQGSASYQRLNKELVPTPIYRDSSVEPGHDYFYEVTAIDLSGNESARSQEAEVAAR